MEFNGSHVRVSCHFASQFCHVLCGDMTWWCYDAASLSSGWVEENIFVPPSLPWDGMMWSARLNPALQKEPWLITRWADGAQRMSQPQWKQSGVQRLSGDMFLCFVYSEAQTTFRANPGLMISVMSTLFDAQVYGIYESDEVCLIFAFVFLLISWTFTMYKLRRTS